MKLNPTLKMLPIEFILALELTKKSKCDERVIFRAFLQNLEMCPNS